MTKPNARHLKELFLKEIDMKAIQNYSAAAYSPSLPLYKYSPVFFAKEYFYA